MKTVFILAFLVCRVSFSVSKNAALETVSKHGQLSVRGVNIVNQRGQRVQLKGMSLFWDVWMPQYYNEQTVTAIHRNCRSNVVRAAIAALTDTGEGYVANPKATLQRVFAVIDAAIKNNIYVIVDWHDHKGDQHLKYAIEFFNIVTKKYRGVPNIIYETFNEPTYQSWKDVLKPYHEAIIKTIRGNGANNIIVVGTPTWCQSVNEAAASPITGYKNIMYTLHFYARSHTQSLRDITINALNKGLPIFVTEFGTVNADGGGAADVAQSRLWWKLLDEHNISYVNWAISDKSEGASALVPGTTPANVCQRNFLTESGKLVVAQNMA